MKKEDSLTKKLSELRRESQQRDIAALKTAKAFTIQVFHSAQPWPHTHTACRDCADIAICRLTSLAENALPGYKNEWAVDITECDWRKEVR